MMRRPRIKTELNPVPLSGGRIRIGGHVPGAAAVINDRDGSVATLIAAADGTRTPGQIIETVTTAHAGRLPQEVAAGLDQLIANGFAEDAAGPVPPELASPERRDRYDRARRLLSMMDRRPRTSPWDLQALLLRARVTVVGLGGIGGDAAQRLAASGVGVLRCVDGDLVELSNLSRASIYAEQDVGRPKAVAGADRLRQVNSDIQVTGEPVVIASAGEMADLARECDVLLLAAPELREMANQACLDAGTPWVDAGYQGPRAEVALFRPGTGPCWECVRAAGAEAEITAGIRDASTPARPPGPAASGAVPAGLAGSLAAYLVMAFITGVPEDIRPGVVYGLDLIGFQSFTVAPPPGPGCPACSARQVPA